VTADGVEHVAKGSKRAVAAAILDRVETMLAAAGPQIVNR
jgi:hypothetical protein